MNKTRVINIVILDTIVKRTGKLRQTLIDANKNYHVRTVASIHDFQVKIGTCRTDLIIINTDQVTADKLEMINLLRKEGQNGIVLLIVDYITDDFRKLTMDQKNVVFLERPFNKRELHGYIENLLYKGTVYQRSYQRFATLQKAELEAVSRKGKVNSIIYNLSQSGALIEVIGNKQKFYEGDLIRLDVSLNRINRRHNLYAQIMWISTRGQANEHTVLGAQFVKSDEIYGHIMNGIIKPKVA